MESSEQKRIFLAIALSAVVLFGWQSFFGPQKLDKSDVLPKETITSGDTTSINNNASVSTNSSSTQNKPAITAPQNLSILNLKNENHSVEIDSSLSLKDFTNSNSVFPFSDIVGIVDGNYLRIQAIQNNQIYDLNLKTTASTETSYEGYDSNLDITFVSTLETDGKYRISLRSPRLTRYRFNYKTSKKELENRQIREFVTFSNDVEREQTGSDFSADSELKWFSIDFDFHMFGFVMPKKEAFRVVGNEAGKIVVDQVKEVSNFEGYFVFTKKNYDHLTNLGDNLHQSVDFGFFGIIAVPILRGLQFFYDLIPNYGIAIILLTLVIRMLLFPLQFKSFKSMKQMQKIQPELTKLREKFKDDPQRMQKETMALFKKAGANPLGGCLPLVLQMPVFFAFYQVLYNSVELVGAPFILWITDLSIKDPYYVLPLFMGVAFFFQTKLNPSASADPTQKKIMMFMPIIFCFFMKDLPAGLNLYIAVSTVFGIAQQLFVYRMVK